MGNARHKTGLKMIIDRQWYEFAVLRSHSRPALAIQLFVDRIQTPSVVPIASIAVGTIEPRWNASRPSETEKIPQSLALEKKGCEGFVEQHPLMGPLCAPTTSCSCRPGTPHDPRHHRVLTPPGRSSANSNHHPFTTTAGRPVARYEPQYGEPCQPADRECGKMM